VKRREFISLLGGRQLAAGGGTQQADQMRLALHTTAGVIIEVAII
jgi:hypothetical protein